MTSTTSKVRAASDGATAKPLAQDALKDLRVRESRDLISIVCSAVSATADLTHEMHRALYRDKGASPPIEITTWLEHALLTTESADHYLRMLDGVLAEIRSYDPHQADPEEPPF